MSGKAPQPGPVTLGELAASIRDEFLQWDRGLVGTFIALLWKPAPVARAYLQERDPRYTKPWRYLAFSIVANVAMTWFVLDYLHVRERLHIGTGQNAQIQFLLENAAVLTLIVLPLAAVAMRLFFAGLNVRYVDALVVLSYAQGQANLLSIIPLAALAIIGRPLIDTPFLVLLLVYLVWAFASFAIGPWWRRVLAAALSLIAAQAINAGVLLLAIRFIA